MGEWNKTLSTWEMEIMTKDEIRKTALRIVSDGSHSPAVAAVAALASDWLKSNPVGEDFPDNLTDRQRETAEYIRRCIMVNRLPPTIREIMQHLNLSSPNGVMCHIKALVRKGVIVQSDSKKSRGIVLNSRFC